MRRILILLLLMIFSLIGPVEAYVYDHSLDPVGDVNIGTRITDTVSPSPSSEVFLGYQMRFKWWRPGDGVAQLTFAPINLARNEYIDSYTPDTTGTWKIQSLEYIKKKSNQNTNSEKTFNVVQVPEFGPLGLAIPLFLIGLFYTGLRKRML
ncbi:MAG: hypothetical protein Q7J35_11065 [Candidatus Methanoperedens sp.]|nr:hypothetical protein [Candidatus Methanoperedens sp.]